MHRHLKATGLLAVPALVAACNTSTAKAAPVVTTNPPSAPATASPPSTAPPTIGTTLAAGSTYVTVTKIIDPASPANQYLNAGAGNRLVGVKFVITNRASKILSDDINLDATVQGSNGQTYTAFLGDISGCTNFNHGTFTIRANQVQTGCASFAIPNGVTVAQVQFALTGSNLVGDWKV